MSEYLYRIGQRGAEEVRSQIKAIGGEGEATNMRLLGSAQRRFTQEQNLERQLEAVRKGRVATEERLNALIGGPEAQAAWNAQQRAAAASAVAMRGAASSSGLLQAGIQQGSFQFQDFIVQISGGTSAVRAFAVQGPQMFEALRMMVQGASNGAGAMGRLAAVLQGPLGIGLSLAVPLAALFAQNLFETAKAAKAAETGTSGLAQAQSVLGSMFDLTTGKVKDQNELLRLNARLTAINLRADALKESEGSKKGLSQAALSSRVTGGAPITMGNFAGMRGFDVVSSDVSDLAREAQYAIKNIKDPAARTKALDAILKRSARVDFKGAKVNGEEFRQFIIDAASATAKNLNADELEKTLDTGVLSKMFRQPGPKGKEGKKDKKEADPYSFGDARAELLKGFQADQKAFFAPLSEQGNPIDKLLEADEKRIELMHSQLGLSEDMKREIKDITANMDEAQRAGERFIDTVFDPTNWNDFGDLGMKVLRELQDEFIKLAILNPIKNSLFKSDTALPTITSVLSNVKFLGFASGTERAPGGLSLVGEHGAEIVDLPSGSKVIPASQTRRMMAGRGGVTVPIAIHIDATGADAAALGRLQAQLAAMQRDLPGTIVATVNEANQRGMLAA